MCYTKNSKADTEIISKLIRRREYNMLNINDYREFDLEVYASEVSALKIVLDDIEPILFFLGHRDDEHMKIWAHMSEELNKTIKAVYKGRNLCKQVIRTNIDEFFYYKGSIDRLLESGNIDEKKMKHLNNVSKRLGARYSEIIFELPKGYMEAKVM